MNMKKMNVTNRMYEAGALAIVRAETLDRACEIAEGCMKGGVPVMEMSYTLNTPEISYRVFLKNMEMHSA